MSFSLSLSLSLILMKQPGEAHVTRHLEQLQQGPEVLCVTILEHMSLDADSSPVESSNETTAAG
jgi:hypothetical protein